MSHWTYIRGVVVVSPFGETQAEKTYVVDTVLSHLPVVSGSERNMDTVRIINPDTNCSSSCDELGIPARNPNRRLIDTQDLYTLVLIGDLRDRDMKQTYRELIEWLCRLSKRIIVDEVFVKVTDGLGRTEIVSDSSYFSELFEAPSWSWWGERIILQTGLNT